MFPEMFQPRTNNGTYVRTMEVERAWRKYVAVCEGTDNAVKR
jgi:hypothetical protein